MKLKLVRYGTAATLAAIAMAIAGCGGGGGGGTDTSGPAPAQPVAQALSSAAAVAANDTATNPTAAFSVLQSAGIPAVSINSAPKVNFAVFSDGAVKKGLALSNVSFVLAKLVPGTNGDPDKWVSYTYRTESTATGTANTGPDGKPVLASAIQATSDTKLTGTSTAALTQLTYNADGYYTYTFSSDIADSTRANGNGVTYEPNRTHRIAIQLSYTNAAGQTIRVNPYMDFTVGADGKSVPATASQTRQMVDIATCNGCHDKLALHGGGRVDTQYCVLCHNPSTVDAQSGNNLNLATMAHKIHSGRELHLKGENYVIWGNSASKHDYSEVGFPQPTRNCAACHTAANPKTPQGDNWKTKPTKEACLSCHQSGDTSGFVSTHITTLKLAASVAALPNSACSSCHSPSSPFSPERVHWTQELEQAAFYQGVIESVTLTKAPTATTAGTASVKYAVINPKTGAAYNLTEGCTGAATTDQKGASIPACNTNYRWDANVDPTKWTAPPDKFGTFTLGLAVNTMAQVMDDISGTAGGILPAYRGVNDGTNRYTMDITVPANSKGNARLQLLGSVAERRLDPATRTPSGAVPPKANSDLAYVPVKNALYEFDAATGAKATTTARRQIVSNDNCNACHGILGLPTHADPNKPGFHKGVRNNSETCANCHNANQAGGYTLMTDGSLAPVAGDSQLTPATNTSSFLHESYEAKRFIHGIHGGAKRSFPFTHCLTTGGVYNKDGTSTTGGPALGHETCYNYPAETLNFTAEVAYPAGVGNCNNCHVKDSWKQDKSTLGSVVFKPTGVTNSLDWYVISPKAATCTSCHDSAKAKAHVTAVGTATFGTRTQDDLLNKGLVFETCQGCHSPGSLVGVDKVHSAK